MAERSASESTQAANKNKRQTLAVVLVLVIFVLGGLLLVNWRSIFEKQAPANSIAVIPFEDSRQDGYTANIVENMMAGLMRNITQNSTFSVTPPGDVLKFRTKNSEPQGLGKLLKARAVLTGRVLREGDMISVKTELIEVESGKSIWSGQYDVPVDEANKVSEEISRQVIAAVSNSK